GPDMVKSPRSDAVPATELLVRCAAPSPVLTDSSRSRFGGVSAGSVVFRTSGQPNPLRPSPVASPFATSPPVTGQPRPGATEASLMFTSSVVVVSLRAAADHVPRPPHAPADRRIHDRRLPLSTTRHPFSP